MHLRALFSHVHVRSVAALLAVLATLMVVPAPAAVAQPNPPWIVLDQGDFNGDGDAADVRIDWDPVADAESYTVFHCAGKDCTPDTELGTTSADVTRFDHPSAGDGYHWYAATATDADGNESHRSNEEWILVDATPPVAPSGITGSAIDAFSDGTADDIRLEWNPNSETDLWRYHIYICERTGCTPSSLLSYQPEGDPEYYNDTNKPDGVWRYRLTAVDKHGNESDPSKIVEVAIDPADPEVRLAGSSRFETAATVSADAFPDGADAVYLASAGNFPDALGASAAAGVQAAPVLIVPTDPCGDGCVNGIPHRIHDEIIRLDPTELIVVGGPAAVSEATFGQLQDAGYAQSVSRLAGAGRVDTAVEISRSAFDSNTSTAFVAYGWNFPDALSGTAAAVVKHGPVLLSGQGALSGPTAEELQRLQPSQVYVLGGRAVLSDQVMADIGEALPDASVDRLAGAGRYDTSVSISRAVFTPDLVDNVYLATGGNYPDALSGGSPAGRDYAPLLLVPSTGAVPQSVLDEVRRLGLRSVVVLGGEAVVSQDVVDQVKASAGVG